AALERAGLDPRAVNPEKYVDSLIPTIKGTDKQAAIDALRKALTALRDFRGYTGPEPLYFWLSKNVKDDDVLRGAGIDPDKVKEATKPADPHPDVAALLQISRNMLEMFAAQNGLPPPSDQDVEEMGRAFRAFTGSGTGTATSAMTGRATPGTNVRALYAVPI